MPKMKNHRGVAKRVKRTGSGKFTRHHALRRPPDGTQVQQAETQPAQIGRRRCRPISAASRGCCRSATADAGYEQRRKAMPRVKRGNVHLNRRRRILKQAKGYYGADSRQYASARDAVDHAMQYAYSGRKLRKRDFRRLWITRINAACRQNDLSYSRFIAGLKAAGVGLDRKVLAEIAIADPPAFARIAATARDGLAA